MEIEFCWIFLEVLIIHKPSLGPSLAPHSGSALDISSRPQIFLSDSFLQTLDISYIPWIFSVNFFIFTIPGG